MRLQKVLKECEKVLFSLPSTVLILVLGDITSIWQIFLVGFVSYMFASMYVETKDR